MINSFKHAFNQIEYKSQSRFILPRNLTKVYFSKDPGLIRGRSLRTSIIKKKLNLRRTLHATVIVAQPQRYEDLDARTF